MIFCEFNYCIYNTDNTCTLKAISISQLGVCDNCIIPDIKKEVLEKYKQELLEKLKTKK